MTTIPFNPLELKGKLCEATHYLYFCDAEGIQGRMKEGEYFFVVDVNVTDYDKERWNFKLLLKDKIIFSSLTKFWLMDQKIIQEIKC